jgi:hypothetical protein
MARRAYKPVATVTRNRRAAKLANQEATDRVGRIRADTGPEPEFHRSVQQKGQSTALEIRLQLFQLVMTSPVRSCFL